MIKFYHEKRITGSQGKPNFIILSEYFDTYKLAGFLRSAGWRELRFSDPPTKNEIRMLPKVIDFYWLDGKYKYGLYKSIIYNFSYLRPFVKLDRVINKAELYLLITNEYPDMADKILPESYIYPGVNIQDIEESKYIIRPVQGFSGKGLSVVRNKRELERDLQELSNSFNGEIVISKYLTNLILFDDRIFHIRYYIIVGIINNRFVSEEIRLYPIATAKDKFSIERETDKDVFDSHFKYNSNDHFLEELKDYDIYTIKKNIQEVVDFVTHLVKQEINCYYEESDNCYDILGLDLMVQKSLKVNLIEVNHKVGFGLFKNEVNTNKLRNMLFSSLIEYFMKPVFPELRNKTFY